MLVKKILLEAVTVCIDYSDFLSEVIPCNIGQIDSWTIVTTPEDRATQTLCARYGLRCLATRCMYRDAAAPAFNKSRAINYALSHKTHSGWMLHLDADIALPPHFRRSIENAELDERTLYGMDRFNCHSAEAWDAHRCESSPQYEWGCLVNPPKGFAMGARLTHGDYGGYLPIGAFQLWHPKGSGVDRYPIKADSHMEHTDVLHAIQWERHRRALLPEGFLVHLETSCRKGANWNGRRSPQFRSAQAAPDFAAQYANDRRGYMP